MKQLLPFRAELFCVRDGISEVLYPVLVPSVRFPSVSKLRGWWNCTEARWCRAAPDVAPLCVRSTVEPFNSGDPDPFFRAGRRVRLPPRVLAPTRS